MNTMKYMFFGRLIIILSIFMLGNCVKKPMLADEVTTNAVRAESIPEWVPANTDPSVRFYFIADMGIYYDAFIGSFVYWNGSYWIYSTALPHGYVYLDLFDSNIVFLSVGITYPWHNHLYYVEHYPIYFFVGPGYKSRGYGWRFYNENGRKYFHPHHAVKYNMHYNVHQYKNKMTKPGKTEERGKPDIQKQKHEFPSGKQTPYKKQPLKQIRKQSEKDKTIKRERIRKEKQMRGGKQKPGKQGGRNP